MKEIFRHKELIYVKQYADVLEDAGVPTMVRNDLAMSGLSEIPIPEFYPNLCVNEEDAVRARETLNEHVDKMAAGAEVELTCSSCGEVNPGNFDVCFSCQEPLNPSVPC